MSEPFFTIKIEKLPWQSLPKEALRGLVSSFSEIERACFTDPWSDAVLEGSLLFAPSLVISARHDAAVAGFAVACVAADICEVQDIAVLPALRRRGAALGMLLELFRFCRGSDMSELQLEVRSKNLAAISLYEKLGFEKVGLRRAYYSAPVDDAVLMTAYLRPAP